jgi:hypothetical protein
VQRAFEWVFRSRIDGRIVIAQSPNLSLWIFVVARVVGAFLDAGTKPANSETGCSSCGLLQGMRTILLWLMERIGARSPRPDHRIAFALFVGIGWCGVTVTLGAATSTSTITPTLSLSHHSRATARLRLLIRRRSGLTVCRNGCRTERRVDRRTNGRARIRRMRQSTV